MAYKIVFLIAMALAACSAAPSDSGSLFESRIVGGTNAPVGAAPHQVSLRYDTNDHYCGGSIISARTILTAAHCVEGRTITNTIVVVGTNYLNSGGTRYKVSKMTMHSAYNPSSLVNDIAVIITTANIAMSSVVAPISLGTAELPENTVLSLTGWGMTTYPSQSIPNNLQIISLNSVLTSTCKTALAKIGPVFDTQVCTYVAVGKGACQGDSGGPLIQKGSPNTLVGIVSWGMPCAQGYPDVFTKVSSYITWIKANMV